MPIAYYQFANPAEGSRFTRRIATILAAGCVGQQSGHFTSQTERTGIGGGSCWAAVATARGEPYPGQRLDGAENTPLDFGIVYGNSQARALNQRLINNGLDGGLPGTEVFDQNHAERVALTQAQRLQLYTIGVAGLEFATMYVELHPCNACTGWLEGVENPFHARLQQENFFLHVWYRWPHPAGTADMEDWHRNTPDERLSNITLW